MKEEGRGGREGSLRAGSRENVSCVSYAESVRRGQTLTSLGPRWTVTLWLCKRDGERKSGKETKVADFRGHFHAIGKQMSTPLDCTSYWKAHDNLSKIEGEKIGKALFKYKFLREHKYID